MHKSSGTTYIDSNIKGKDKIIMPIKAFKGQISFFSITPELLQEMNWT